MTQEPAQTEAYYKLSLPAEIAQSLVELRLAKWELAGERSPAEVADLVVAVGSSLGPMAVVGVGKALVDEASHRIVQLFAEKWRATRGERRLTVDLRARQGQTSLRVEITGASDADAVRQILRALADAAPGDT
jgi:hypothetical protein